MSSSLFSLYFAAAKLPLVQVQQNVFKYLSTVFSHVMFKNNSDAMHVQPSLPEVGIHGEDGLPVGGKLGLRGVFGSAVLQRQDLE